MSSFEKLLLEENLVYGNQQPNYEMRVIHTPNKGKNVSDDDIIHSELKFTSLTDFNLFLLSDHYDNIVKSTDDRIIVVNLETDEIVFDTDKDD
jgi:hypothetical protein